MKRITQEQWAVVEQLLEEAAHAVELRRALPTTRREVERTARWELHKLAECLNALPLQETP